MIPLIFGGYLKERKITENDTLDLSKDLYGCGLRIIYMVKCSLRKNMLHKELEEHLLKVWNDVSLVNSYFEQNTILHCSTDFRNTLYYGSEYYMEELEFGNMDGFSI